MGLINNKSEKKRREEFNVIAEKKRKTKLTLGDLIIPLASGVVLVILSFAVFVPMVKSAFQYLEEIKVAQGKIEQLEKLNKQLDRIDENQLNEDVLTSREVIPNILLVSDLIYYLDNLAKSLDLSISKLVTSDTLDSVSGPITYEGEYNDVITFLDQAQNVSPYMLRLENAEVKRNTNETNQDVWEIELTISGYYMADGNEQPDIYADFQPYTEYSDIVEIFRTKAESKF